MIKWRLLILLAVGLFCLSDTLLVVASTNPQRIEAGQVTLLGIVDVATAFVVAILGMVIYGKGVKLVELAVWKNSYQVATVLPVLLLIIIWLSLDKIAWLDVLLPGLAWRIYLLIQTLPPAIALWKNDQESKV